MQYFLGLITGLIIVIIIGICLTIVEHEENHFWYYLAVVLSFILGFFIRGGF